MQFTKISLTKPTESKLKWSVRLEWAVERVNDAGETVTDERTLRSTDAPRGSFWGALQDLVPAVLDACMLDEGLAAEEREDLGDAITVRGVTLKDLDEGEGVTITALRELDWAPSPLVLNTPFALASTVPTDELEAKLEALRMEAVAYARGKRNQPDLFEAGERFQEAMEGIEGIDRMTIIRGDGADESVVYERDEA